MIHLQLTFAKNVALLIQYVLASGYFCTLGEAYRTPEQALIYAHEHIGIVHSLHCERLAVDLNIFDGNYKYMHDTEVYRKFGEYWERLDRSNRWGGRFKHLPDGNHFEMNPAHEGNKNETK